LYVVASPLFVSPGYPWIDACMTQLRNEGWIHHLARHAVACFLTRGDLFQHWEEGAVRRRAPVLVSMLVRSSRVHLAHKPLLLTLSFSKRIFEKLLVDGDWSLNRANWMWLSCSSFFYQFFR
jgi:cryptochrome